MPILVNTSKHFSRHVYSHDGDSITIPPNGRTEVGAKFMWNLPPDVREYKNSVPVNNKSIVEEKIVNHD